MEAQIWKSPLVSTSIGAPLKFQYDDYHVVWRTNTDIATFLATRGQVELGRILDKYIDLLTHELSMMDRQIEILQRDLLDSIEILTSDMLWQFKSVNFTAES